MIYFIWRTTQENSIKILIQISFLLINKPFMRYRTKYHKRKSNFRFHFEFKKKKFILNSLTKNNQMVYGNIGLSGSNCFLRFL
jgi:hypothetical protein